MMLTENNINKINIFLLVLVIIEVLLILYIVYDTKFRARVQQNSQQNSQQNKEILRNVGAEQPFVQEPLNIILDNEYNTGIVQNYDRSKLYDPLVNPDRRPNRYELPRTYFKKQIDIATQGYPDSYVLMGLLHHKDQILKLFGRQEYPGSYRYEYYALDDNFGNYIKFSIENRKNEIYDGDRIKIKGLKGLYKANLYKYDLPRYLPDIL